jgi:DNA-binding Lrp family transcriptional regulator
MVNLSPAAAKRRMDRLESAGVIRGYTAILDHTLLGSGRAFTELHFAPGTQVDEIDRALDGLPELVEGFTLAGDPDTLVHLRVSSVGPRPRILLTELITAGLLTVDIIELPDAQDNHLGDRRFRAGTHSRCRGLRSTGSDSWLPPNGRPRRDPAARLTSSPVLAKNSPETRGTHPGAHADLMKGGPPRPDRRSQTYGSNRPQNRENPVFTGVSQRAREDPNL